ncbi:MAG: hypothetical protein ACLPH3_09340 [Terracidiphilus sp.]
MEPGHCEHGSQLYDLYYDKSVDWAMAEAGVRAAYSKLEYERARCDYIAHVVGCSTCAWDVLTFTYLDGIEPADAAHAVCAEH